MENSYLLIALCSMFFYGAGDVVFKIAARKGLPSHQFLIMKYFVRKDEYTSQKTKKRTIK